MILRILSGWHINAHKPSESTLIGTTLSIAPGSDATLVRIIYPAEGRKTRFAFSSQPLDVYQGEDLLKATVRFARPNSHLLRFTLRYQACNERSCLAPSSIDVGVRDRVIALRTGYNSVPMFFIPQVILRKR